MSPQARRFGFDGRFLYQFQAGAGAVPALNFTADAYPGYGGRGLSVCEPCVGRDARLTEFGLDYYL